MVRHIILWKLKAASSPQACEDIKANIKRALEGLQGQIPGLLSVKVHNRGLASSSAQVMLDCTFENEEALRAYRVHPAHVKAADTFVRPYTEIRLCLDYQE